MADQIGSLRSLLSRPVSLDEALSAYLGMSPAEADRHAEGLRTSEGLLSERLRALVTLLFLREAPPRMAMLVAAVLWRSAPVAVHVNELRDAIARICLWRGGLSDADVVRIAAAHRRHDVAHAAMLRRGGMADGPEADALLKVLSEGSRGHSVVCELARALLIVTMTDADYFVGLMDEDELVMVIDRIPYGRGPDDRMDGEPVAPDPSLLLDA